MARQLIIAFLCYSVASHSIPSEPSRAKFGRAKITNGLSFLSASRNERIIGGEPASIEEYPYVVSLQQNGTFFGHDFEHFCGGNIIGEKWILTAAKCCYGKKPSQFHVRVGSRSYYAGGRIYEIESIAINPSYNHTTWDYDVGLLKLHEAIVFSDKVQPIRLPEVGRSIESNTVVDIAGWGTTTLLGMPSETLNRNRIKTMSQDACRSVYSENSVTDRMFCVFDVGHGPCIGDTGSPAVIDYVIVGVASWSQSCAYEYPTAYARLPEMVDWIIKVTGNSSSRASNARTTGNPTRIEWSRTCMAPDDHLEFSFFDYV